MRLAAFKLTIVAGPKRGTSYAMKEGEVTIGRQGGNVISLDSARVSKRHCVVSVHADEVVVRDDGSANGTFVNGVLAKEKRLQAGDRIGVGEYVLELVRTGSDRRPAPFGGNVLSFPMSSGGVELQGQSYPAPSGGSMPTSFGGNYSGAPNLGSAVGATASPGQEVEPDDLKGKLLFKFDRFVMPFFYDLNFRQEWKSVCFGLFGVFVIANLFLTISPLLDASRRSAVKEVERRAAWMARQIVERNAGFLVARTETRTDIGTLEREEGVRVAVLIDLDNRILAPSGKYNQYLAAGAEARLAVLARNAFLKGRETGISQTLGSDLVAAIEPVKIYNAQQGRNQVVGMAVVSIDTRGATLEWGELGLIYSQNLIITAILGAFLMLILYRLTLKPFQVLNEDLDRALRGEISQVTHEFKIEELNPLWEVVDSAIQRIPTADAGSGASAPRVSADDLVRSVRMLGDGSKHGVALFDAARRFLYVNSPFEEVTGIREDNAVGNEVMQVARDQAFVVLTSDLYDRATVGGDPAVEEFEFSGVAYRTSMAALGTMGAPAIGWVLSMERKEE